MTYQRRNDKGYVEARNAKDGAVMIQVPAGSFRMGSENGGSNEKPMHEVFLDEYWIDKYEVTNEQFARFVSETRYETEAEKRGKSYGWDGEGWKEKEGWSWKHPRGPGSAYEADHPVVHVSWNDAEAYARWAGKELPTEAEWEKAARGKDGRKYPWGEEEPDGTRCNFADQRAKGIGLS
jgi:sulfatase modifying factor 1